MKDLDMYEMPYQDHDPLLGITVTIAIIIVYYILVWIREKIIK